MGAYEISALFNFGISTTLAWYLFLKSRADRTALLFAALCAAVSLWSLGIFLWQLTASPGAVLLWLKISMAGLIAVAPLFLHIAARIVKSARSKVLIITNYAAAALFLGLVFTKYLIVSATGGEGAPPRLGVGFALLLAYVVVAMGATFWFIARRRTQAQDVHRLRLTLLFIWGCFGLVGFFAALAPWYGVTAVSALSICVSIFLSGTAYALTAERFLDLGAFFKKAFIYGASLGLAVLLAYGLFVLTEDLATVSEIAKNTIVAALSSLFLLIFLVFFARLYTTLFGGEAVVEEFSLDESIAELGSLLEFDKLLPRAVDLLRRIGHTDHVGFLIRTSETSNVEAAQFSGFDADHALFAPANNPLLRLMRSSLRAMTREEFLASLASHGAEAAGERESLTRMMDELRVQLIVPLVVNGDLRGVFVLGPKQVGASYSEHDVEHVSRAAQEAALAVENARSHEDVRAFTSYLQNLNRDLTQRVKDATAAVAEKNKELEEANRRLEELDKLKTEFLNMASHQLRTPTTVIRGMMSMILNNEVDAETKQSFMEKIFDAANRLAALINDLLNIAYIEGGMTLKLEEADIAAFAGRIVEELRQAADAKNLKLTFAKPDGPVVGRIDARRLHEAVYNLVDNAIKYTHAGSVAVSLGEQGGAWRLTVADTGIGVKKEDIGKLFQKFFRTDEAMQEASRGTGLGLYVVKKIIEEHGGRVSIASEGAGKGTAFTVEMPREPKIIAPSETKK